MLGAYFLLRKNKRPLRILKKESVSTFFLLVFLCVATPYLDNYCKFTVCDTDETSK